VGGRASLGGTELSIVNARDDSGEVTPTELSAVNVRDVSGDATAAKL
jgi:hypothetical protein